MDVIVRGSKITITKAMKDYAQDKISKLDKYVEGAREAVVNLDVKGHINKVEVTIVLPSFILRAEEQQEDFYAAIDVVVDKLERQIRKNKTRITSNKMKTAKDFVYDYIEEIDEEEVEEDKIVKRKKIELKPMSEEEAILQMELLGHSFFLFKDQDTLRPTLVYKRNDGNYGIIES